MNKDIPKFLQHVKLTEVDEAFLPTYLNNWLTLFEYFHHEDFNIDTCEKMMVIELGREKPRKQLIDRMIAKHSAMVKTANYSEMEEWLKKQN